MEKTISFVEVYAECAVKKGTDEKTTPIIAKIRVVEESYDTEKPKEFGFFSSRPLQKREDISFQLRLEITDDEKYHLLYETQVKSLLEPLMQEGLYLHQVEKKDKEYIEKQLILKAKNQLFVPFT